MEPPVLKARLDKHEGHKARADARYRILNVFIAFYCLSHLVLLSVAAAENPVSSAGSQSRALLRRVSAKRQPDWKWNRRCGIPCEAPFFVIVFTARKDKRFIQTGACKAFVLACMVDGHTC